MDLRYINPFVTSAINVIKESLGLVASKKQIYVAKGKESLGGVSIFFDILGDVEGQIIFDLPTNITTILAKTMIGLNLKEVSIDAENKDMFKSAITELANMISGNAITKLEEYNYNCDIRPPLVYVGNKTRLTHPSVRTIVIEMNTEVGDFSINLVNRQGFHLQNLSCLLVNIPDELVIEIVHTFIPKGFYIYSSHSVDFLAKKAVDFLIIDINSIVDKPKLIINKIRSFNENTKIIFYVNRVSSNLLITMKETNITGCILKNKSKLQVISNIQTILTRLGIRTTERRKNIYVTVFPNDKFNINLKKDPDSNDLAHRELIKGELLELGITGVVFRPEKDKLVLFKTHDDIKEIQLNLRGKYVLVSGVVSDIKGDNIVIRFIAIKEKFVNALAEVIYNKIAYEL